MSDEHLSDERKPSDPETAPMGQAGPEPVDETPSASANPLPNPVPPYGAPYGAPQNDTPQTGVPQTGTPQTGTPQTGTSQTSAQQNQAPQYGAPRTEVPPYGGTPFGAPPYDPASGAVPADATSPVPPQGYRPGQVPPAMPASGAPGDVPPYGQPPYGGYPQQPGQPGAPGVPGGPGVPGQPGTPGVPGVPGVPYTGPTQPAAPAKNRKPLIIGLSVGGVAIVAVVALVLFLVLSPGKLTTQDYTDAMSQVSKMTTGYSNIDVKLHEVYMSTYGSGQTFDQDDVNTVKDRIKNYKATVDGFKDEAVMRDDAVKSKYDAYVKASDKYVTYATNLADSAEPMSAAMKACGSTPTASTYGNTFYDEYNTYITSCTAALDKIAKSPVKSIAEFNEDMREELTKMRDLLGRMQALGNPADLQYGTDQYNQMRDLRSQFIDLDVYDVTTGFSQDLQEEDDKASPRDALEDLMHVLNDGFQDTLHR